MLGSYTLIPIVASVRGCREEQMCAMQGKKTAGANVKRRASPRFFSWPQAAASLPNSDACSLSQKVESKF